MACNDSSNAFQRSRWLGREEQVYMWWTYFRPLCLQTPLTHAAPTRITADHHRFPPSVVHVHSSKVYCPPCHATSPRKTLTLALPPYDPAGPTHVNNDSPSLDPDASTHSSLLSVYHLAPLFTLFTGGEYCSGHTLCLCVTCIYHFLYLI